MFSLIVLPDPSQNMVLTTPGCIDRGREDWPGVVIFEMELIALATRWIEGLGASAVDNIG